MSSGTDWWPELTQVAERLTSEPRMRVTRRVSRRGVPHLVVRGAARSVSVCWFNRRKVLRTFSPCFSYGASQHKRNWELEDLEDLVCYLRNELEERQLQEADDVWVTRMGERVRVSEMGDNHLVNTILFLQRHATKNLAALTACYVMGPAPRGEMAQDAFDREFDAVLDYTWQDKVPAIFWLMLTEAEHRGLRVVLPTDREELMQRLALELAMMGVKS